MFTRQIREGGIHYYCDPGLVCSSQDGKGICVNQIQVPVNVTVRVNLIRCVGYIIDTIGAIAVVNNSDETYKVELINQQIVSEESGSRGGVSRVVTLTLNKYPQRDISFQGWITVKQEGVISGARSDLSKSFKSVSLPSSLAVTLEYNCSRNQQQ